MSALLLLWCLSFSGACVFDSLVMSGENSFSHGPSRHGALYEGALFPEAGTGFRTPSRWQQRGLRFAVPEMVSMLVYLGRSLAKEDKDLVLSVADLSMKHGGRSAWHRSHQTGRDVDLLFFLKDGAGNTVSGDSMLKLDSQGRAMSFKEEGAKERSKAKEALGIRRFDVAANWKLIALLLDNPVAEVQYIFMQDDLRQLVLEYAEKAKVAESVLERAALILHQPGDSAPHNDHFHVRIYCSRSDRRYGCKDFGQMRWQKKDAKYGGRIERFQHYLRPMPTTTVRALPWVFR